MLLSIVIIRLIVYKGMTITTTIPVTIISIERIRLSLSLIIMPTIILTIIVYTQQGSQQTFHQ
jgi:hypothetical protein